MINETAFYFVVFNALFFSTFAFIFSLIVYTKVKAQEMSTHTIEFRDPNLTYEDELVLTKDASGKVQRETINNYDQEDEYSDSEFTIDSLNKEIKDEDLIL